MKGVYEHRTPLAHDGAMSEALLFLARCMPREWYQVIASPPTTFATWRSVAVAVCTTQRGQLGKLVMPLRISLSPFLLFATSGMMMHVKGVWPV